MEVSAPGKLVILGDYAVLAGGPAMVAAVNRRAIGRIHAHANCSAVIQGVFDEALNKGLSVPAGVEISTSGFQNIDGQKLGIGSSAAVAVVTAGLVSPRVDDERLELALKGHRRAAGGVGSGIDVAVSFYGGVIATHAQPAPVRSLAFTLPGLYLTVLYVNKSALTRVLVQACQGGPSWLRWTDVMSQLAARGIEAWQTENASVFLEVIRNYGRAMESLGRDAGVEIVTSEIKEVMQAAEAVGGAAKPSGAGGGDVVVLFTRELEHAQQVVKQTGAQWVDLRLDSRGLEVHR